MGTPDNNPFRPPGMALATSGARPGFSARG